MVLSVESIDSEPITRGYALTTLHVSLSSDDNPGGIGDAGDLRYAINTSEGQSSGLYVIGCSVGSNGRDQSGPLLFLLTCAFLLLMGVRFGFRSCPYFRGG